MTSNFIFLYGIIDNLTKRAVESFDYFDYDGCYLLYKEVTGKDYSLDLNNLQQYDQALKELMEGVTLLPFSFGTVVKSKEKIDQFIRANDQEITELLQEYQGKFEMGLKIFTMDEKLVGSAKPRRSCSSSGKEYMMKLYQKHQESEERKELVEAKLVPIIKLLEEESYQVEFEISTGKRLIFDGAYLINKREVGSIQEQLADLNLEEERLIYQSSGPWPPYSFVEF
ncbi:GvpL/GvpF family gas vesicle protein [Natroniella sulfidigena]|uniref:GvpL/GvpF family gas vesicle protein n=1 Tax=Natroniella sulfidigena TaxID=723921 RepID=UPI00200AB5AD|nr:GvpL/GvpF family gas vesicle protein [Natroniella sulfidigena]MCK8817049.1 GvpL/GvpF family gas vesicle protein [Natroniella sulfidigena]